MKFMKNVDVFLLRPLWGVKNKIGLQKKSNVYMKKKLNTLDCFFKSQKQPNKL